MHVERKEHPGQWKASRYAGEAGGGVSWSLPQNNMALGKDGAAPASYPAGKPLFCVEN